MSCACWRGRAECFCRAWKSETLFLRVPVSQERQASSLPYQGTRAHDPSNPSLHLATYPLQGISVVFVAPLAQDGKAPLVQWLCDVSMSHRSRAQSRMDQVFVMWLIFPILMPYHAPCPILSHSLTSLLCSSVCPPCSSCPALLFVLLSRSPRSPSSPRLLLLSSSPAPSLAFLPLLLSALSLALRTWAVSHRWPSAAKSKLRQRLNWGAVFFYQVYSLHRKNN